MADKSPKKVDESKNTDEHSGDEGFPTLRDEHGNRILKKPVTQQTRNDMSTGTETGRGEGTTGKNSNAANAETGGGNGETAPTIIDDRPKKTPPRDDATDDDFEAEYLTSNRLDQNLEKDVLAAENILVTLHDMPQNCRDDLDDILEFEGVIEHSIQSLRNPSRTIEPELYGRIVDANQALLRWKARMNKWKRQFVDQPLSSGSSQNSLWEDQVAAQKLAERQAAEEEKRCRNWEGSMAAVLLSQKKLTDQLVQLRTQRDAYQTELAGVRTSLDQLRAEGKAFGLAEAEIEGREEVLLNQAIAAERARSAAGRSPVMQQKPTDPASRQRRAEVAGAKRKSDSDFSVFSANSKKSRTQASIDERAEPMADHRRSAANDNARASTSNTAHNSGAQKTNSANNKKAPEAVSYTHLTLPTIYSV